MAFDISKYYAKNFDSKPVDTQTDIEVITEEILRLKGMRARPFWGLGNG